MTQLITDFSEQQVNAVQAQINRCYGEKTELHLGDSEVQVDREKEAIVSCPVIFWKARKCNFVIIKTGADQYRAQYFYTSCEAVNTRQAFFTALEDCAAAVLSEQSDYERESEGVTDVAAGADLH